MGRMAILKPDHLGDLVLSVPAIRAICSQHPDPALFVAPGSVGLAKHLFPEIDDIRAVGFQHLSRKPIEGISPKDFVQCLRDFDFLFCLRDDDVMREIAHQSEMDHTITAGGILTHETAIQKRAVTAVIGDYSRTRLFSDLPIFWPEQLEHVGLCIAAGFPTNRWPNAYWLDLAQQLAGRGIFLTLIGGPGERDDLNLLSQLLGKAPHRVLQGGSDFHAFFDALAPVDLVVASDGGTAHLCSLHKPICSVFGSSPWRRYAPFGRDNVMITRDEICSPCVQFSPIEINGCMTRECTALLQPQQVARVLLSNGLELPKISGTRVERGISHHYDS